jgi:hypothetical protein
MNRFESKMKWNVLQENVKRLFPNLSQLLIVWPGLLHCFMNQYSECYVIVESRKCGVIF